MTACSTFSSLRKQIDTNGKGSTLRAKLHSLKGTSLVKDYMTCMRSGIKSKKRRSTSKRSSKKGKSRRSR
jgi:hypothetical protein